MNFDFDENELYDFYEILEVEKDATSKQIRENFIKLVKKHHPDHGGNVEIYEKLMRAFECLINENSRKEYDLKQQTNDQNYNLISHFKNDFTKFTDTTFVPKTKEEIEDLYANIFNTTIDETLNEDEFAKHILDRQTERDQYEIESVNNDLKNILDNNPSITFNDLVDYFKSIDKKSTDLINYKAFNEMNDDFSRNYNFINETPDKIKYNDCNISKEHIQNFSVEAYNEWKQLKTEQKKITKNDVENYIKMREAEDLELREIIESNIKKIKNTTNDTLYLQNNN